MSKHTPGMTAAIALHKAGLLHPDAIVSAVAEMIDRETAAPELAEALLRLYRQVEGIEGFAGNFEFARAALARAGVK